MRNKIINKYIIILALVILFQIMNNIYFLSQDNLPLLYDNYERHGQSLSNFNQFKEGNINGLINQFFFFHDSPLISYPSFFHYFLVGTAEDVTSFQGTIFLVILIIATYLLGKELFSRDVGLLGAILISFMPLILAMSKVPYDDIAFTAMFILTVYFFLKSKKFSDIKFTWLFNISLGLALLSKFNSIFFLATLAFTYLTLKLIFDRNDLRRFFLNLNRTKIKHFLISFFISMLLPIIFYFNYSLLIVETIYSVYDKPALVISNLLPAIVNYLQTIHLAFENYSVFIIFIIALIFFFLYDRKHRLFVFSLLLSANLYHILLLFFFPLTITNIYRLLVFIKPVYIIIISLFFIDYLCKFLSKAFNKLKLRFLRKTSYALCLTLIILFFSVSFTLYFNYSKATPEPTKLNYIFGRYHPIRLNYDVNELIDDMSNGKGNKIVFIFSPPSYFTDIFNSYARADYDNIEVLNTDFAESDLKFNDKYNLPVERYNKLITNNSFQTENLEEFDYIILSENAEKEEFYTYHTQISGYIASNPGKFSVLKRIITDDKNNAITIFKK